MEESKDGSKLAADRLRFDPRRILENVSFPLDTLETHLTRLKVSRLSCLRKSGVIWLLNDASADRFIPKENTGYADKSLLRLDVATAAAECAMAEEELVDYLQQASAAIIIQSAMRSWFTRVLLLGCASVDYSNVSFIDSFSASNAANSTIAAPDEGSETCTVRPSTRHRSRHNQLPPLDLEALESLRQKYEVYCLLFEKLLRPLPLFPNFAATLIQSIYRGKLVRRYIGLYKSVGGELGKLPPQEQRAIARYVPLLTKQKVRNIAAKIVQRQWRRYYNRKIFQFYRDLVSFRNTGTPKQLLKFIQPRESALVEKASHTHIKFRLGGEQFPPTVYYKIFAHLGLVDINSFAPREYWKNVNKLANPAERHGKSCSTTGASGWYQRIENNGWRPIMDKIWHPGHPKTVDWVAERTSKKTVVFHHSRTLRREELIRLQKQKKVAWLSEM